MCVLLIYDKSLLHNTTSEDNVKFENVYLFMTILYMCSLVPRTTPVIILWFNNTQRGRLAKIRGGPKLMYHKVAISIG